MISEQPRQTMTRPHALSSKSHQKQRGLPRCYTPPGKATLKYRSLNCLGFDIRGIGHRKLRVGFFAKFLA